MSNINTNSNNETRRFVDAINDSIRANARLGALSGFIMVVLGILAIASPFISGIAASTLVAATMVAAGMTTIFFCFKAGSFGSGFTQFFFGGITTLAGTFADAGYHTQAVGKMHVFPARNLLGFHNVVLHDGYLHNERAHTKDLSRVDDYLPWLKENYGRDVVTACVDTGGIDDDAAKALEERAMALGAIEHVLIDAKQIFFETVIKYLIAGNVLRGNAYPLCVGAERGIQHDDVDVPPSAVRPKDFVLPPEFVDHSPRLEIPMVRVGDAYRADSIPVSRRSFGKWWLRVAAAA